MKSNETACNAQQFRQPDLRIALRCCGRLRPTFGGSNSDNNNIEENLMECACGCGGNPAAGKFLPGHDQRLRADLERRVGGLIQLRMLVEAAEYFADGSIGSSMFNSMVKDLLQNRGESQ
jgi:hypothetical protein